MKKIIAAALAGAALFTVAACSSEADIDLETSN